MKSKNETECEKQTMHINEIKPLHSFSLNETQTLCFNETQTFYCNTLIIYISQWKFKGTG